MAVMIMNAYEMAAEEIVGVQPPEISDDAQIDEWAKDSVYKAYHTELLSGMESGGFAPKENATRAQAAA